LPEYHPEEFRVEECLLLLQSALGSQVGPVRQRGPPSLDAGVIEGKTRRFFAQQLWKNKMRMPPPEVGCKQRAAGLFRLLGHGGRYLTRCPAVHASIGQRIA